ncbi:hypothetical protein LEP1GSC191_4055 [Leptospira borgpetersenii serovar Mini str. 201000851]|nr:hypothetical protein LEP1GSC191_4055 [Leptospira borgpetersenii serovar Mini str. 201000851]
MKVWANPAFDKQRLDRAFRSNSFGISTTIAFAFVKPNSCFLKF